IEPGAAPRAGPCRIALVLGPLRTKRERAIAGGDHISLPEQDSLNPHPVDFCSVGASKIDEVADRGIILDLEVLARERKILRHGERNARRSPYHERAGLTDRILLTLMGPGGHAKDDAHPPPLPPQQSGCVSF